MNLKLHNLLWLCFFMLGFTIESASQTPVGKWTFDAADNLVKAEIGADLDLAGAALAIPGPDGNDGAVRIDIGSHFGMAHGIEPIGQDEKVNEWSLLIDFRVSQLDIWHTFFQTNPANEDDGDCFKNTSGFIGVWVTGYSAIPIEVDQWYRLVISVELGYSYNYYLDGELLHEGTPQDVDGRFALNPELLLFADEDEEDGEIDIAQVAIWNYPLSDEAIKVLGGVGGGAAVVDEKDPGAVHGFALEQNYPNPFNPATTIHYQIPKADDVEVTVYNLSGQKIAALVSARQEAGTYAVNWNADGFPSGVYLYCLRAGQNIESRKMLLMQ